MTKTSGSGGNNNSNRKRPLKDRLTPKERSVLQFILDYRAANAQASPTYSEIEIAFGFTSRLATRRYVNTLIDKGWLVQREFNVARGLTPLVDEGDQLLNVPERPVLPVAEEVTKCRVLWHESSRPVVLTPRRPLDLNEVRWLQAKLLQMLCRMESSAAAGAGAKVGRKEEGPGGEE